MKQRLKTLDVRLSWICSNVFLLWTYSEISLITFKPYHIEVKSHPSYYNFVYDSIFSLFLMRNCVK